MRDKPTELTVSQQWQRRAVRIDRCGSCFCALLGTSHVRLQLSASVFVNSCGSHYCNHRGKQALEELRGVVSAIKAGGVN